MLRAKLMEYEVKDLVDVDSTTSVVWYAINLQYAGHFLSNEFFMAVLSIVNSSLTKQRFHFNENILFQESNQIHTFSALTWAFLSNNFAWHIIKTCH